MDIYDKKYLEDCFIVRKADADGYERVEFTELVNIKVLTPEKIEGYLGEWPVKHELAGSIIYKCTPVFRIEPQTVLKEIK